MSLKQHVVDVLANGEPLAVPAIMRALKQRGGYGVSRSQVERLLGSDPQFVQDGTVAKPLWRFDGDVAPVAVRRELPPLWQWQTDALLAWSQPCSGVVEAVTGTGKTRVALAAIMTVLGQGGRCLVLVPTTELVAQWEREVKRLLPDVAVGRLGAGGDDGLFACEVLIATATSASTLPVDLPPDTPGLVVADEVHRFGAATWSHALPDAFSLRLALTATLERDDDGVDAHLTPYFGPRVFAYDFADAAKDGVIAPFRVAFVPVVFTADEQQAYDTAKARVTNAHRALRKATVMPRDPHAFFRSVTALVAEAERRGHDTPAAKLAREYLYWVRQRRDVYATAKNKYAALATLSPALVDRRTLVFTDTVEQAEEAARLARAHGVVAETLHGELDDKKRAVRMAAFRTGRTSMIVAPRVLDEGVDVPDADVAVVLAAFQTRRQMVQRLGRIVRRKDDGREATLVVVYVKDSREDPAHGGYHEFVELVSKAATEVSHPAQLETVLSRLNPEN